MCKTSPLSFPSSVASLSQQQLYSIFAACVFTTPVEWVISYYNIQTVSRRNQPLGLSLFSFIGMLLLIQVCIWRLGTVRAIYCVTAVTLARRHFLMTAGTPARPPSQRKRFMVVTPSEIFIPEGVVSILPTDVVRICGSYL